MRVAVATARLTGASLFVLLVVATPDAARPASADTPSALPRWHLDRARERGEVLLGEAVAVARREGLNVRAELLENVDSVVQAIVEYAMEWKVDLVVVGTRGLRGFKRMLLGSVSSGLVVHAPCSVMVVR